MSNSETTRFNHLDTQYQNLLQDILSSGTKKGDRTGTGTLSVFGRRLVHHMSEGFPLLTTKKMAWKSMATELIWFLRGDTNIKFLVENNCNIWNGDAYKRYTKLTSANDSQWNEWMRDNGDGTLSMYTLAEFIEKIKMDDIFSKMWGDLGPIYGKQWRDWETVREDNHYFDQSKLNELEEIGEDPNYIHIDQIANLINDLKNNPDSRRLLVNAWNVAEVDKAVLPPCHYGFQCWTRELTLSERNDWYFNTHYKNEDYRTEFFIHHELDLWNVPKRALSLMWNQRSCDFPLGIPYNIASYGLLLMILAKEVNMVPDELIGNFGDCHIYLNQIDGVKEQITRTSFNLPTIVISNKLVNDISEYKLEDFKLINYQSCPKINFPLSN